MKTIRRLNKGHWMIVLQCIDLAKENIRIKLREETNVDIKHGLKETRGWLREIADYIKTNK